jgi:TPR repeat protein
MSQPIDGPNPRERRILVQVFAADPRGKIDQDPLWIDREMQELRDMVDGALYGDAVDFDIRLATRTRDVLQVLDKNHPEIVHFTGHGENEGLILEGRDGQPHVVPVPALAETFVLMAKDVKVVVFNACYSYPQAQAVADVVGCAIGTSSQISDDAATIFGGMFYRAIASGHSVKRAFELARNNLSLDSIPESQHPQLVTARDVDAAAIVLFPSESYSPSTPPPPAPSPSRVRWVAPLAAVIAIAVIAMVVMLVGKNTLETAKRRYVAGSYAGAFPRFKHLAELGDSEAKGYLGIMYMSGWGTAEDDSAGFYWLTEAAKDGDRRGMYALGIAYETGEGVVANPREALRWYEAAERKGEADAMNKIGTLYHRGAPGITQSDDSALIWFNKAAHAGSMDGISNLALMHELGLAGASNPDEALRWHRRAADAGYTRGMVDLGWVHENGIGVRASPDSAAYWYRRAAEADDEFGMNNLGVLYATGRGVPRRDCAMARAWIQQAADRHLPEAQENLARLAACVP